MKKRVLSLLLAVVLLLGMLPGTVLASSLPFTDVAVTDWFYDEVQYVYKNGMMKGAGGGKFSPDVPVTRGMAVTILHRLEGEPAVAAYVFEDVKESDYFYNAVVWANGNGIVKGCGGGKFAPNAPITREQLAVILYRYARYCGKNVNAREDLSAFRDADSVGSYAKEAMSWAVAEKLISGMGGKQLNPGGTASRAQMAALLARFADDSAAAILPLPGRPGGGIGGGTGDTNSGHTVTFMGNIDNTGVYETQQVSNDGYVEVPGTPVYYGYVFKGWSLDDVEENWYDFNAPVTSDLTLYAHWYTLDEAPEYTIEGESEGESAVYGISDLIVEGQTATAIINAVDACTMKIRFYDEETDRDITTVEVAVAGNMSMEPLSTLIPQELPDHFEVEVRLVDATGNDLCDPYICMEYTKVYEEFLTLTPDDFDADRVVYFSESRTEDYGVLSLDVVRVEATQTTNTMTVAKPTYTFDNADSAVMGLQTGDKVVVVENGITTANFVVASIAVDGNTAVVTQEVEAGLEDFYEMVNLEMAETDAPQTYRTRSDVHEGHTEYKISESQSFTMGPFTAEAGFSGKVTVDTKVTYWKGKIISKIYTETKTDGTTSLTFEVAADAEKEKILKNKNYMKEEKTEIEFPEVDIPTPIPVITIPFQIKIPVKVKAAASFSVENKITVVKGAYITLSGINEWDDSYSEFSGTVKGEVQLKGGLGASIGIELFQVAEVGFGVDAGLVIKAEAEILSYQQTTAPSIHGCSLCIDGDVAAYIELKMYAELGKVEFEGKLVALEFPIADFYVSLINHNRSCHGGKVKFGMGECPCEKYRVVVKTEDADGKEIKTDTIIRVDAMTVEENGKSPLAVYLFNGTYTASALYDDGSTTEKTFTVKDAAMTVVIKKGEINDEPVDPKPGDGEERMIFLLPSDYASTDTSIPELSGYTLYGARLDDKWAYIADTNASLTGETMYQVELVLVEGASIDNMPVYKVISEAKRIEWNLENVSAYKIGGLDPVVNMLGEVKLAPDAIVLAVTYDMVFEAYGCRGPGIEAVDKLLKYNSFDYMSVYAEIDSENEIKEMWIFIDVTEWGVW